MSVVADAGVKAALADVRNDANPTTWAVLSYKSKTELTVVGTGTEGGLTAASALFNDEEAFYALIRYDHVVDKSKNVRFVFVDYTADTMKPMRKALVSTHKGEIRKLFDPFHIDLSCADKGDVNEDVVLRKIGLASGTTNLVVDDARFSELKPYSRSAALPEKKKATDYVPKVASGEKEVIKIADGVKDAIKVVRDDSSGGTWLICEYADDNQTIQVSKSGSGDVAEFLAALDNTKAQYGLFRVLEKVDRSQTIKFVYVCLIPESIRPMVRAKYATYAGSVQALFQPFHFEFTVGASHELTPQGIADHISGLTGTKSHVLDEVKSAPKAAPVKKSVAGPAAAPKVSVTLKFTDESAFKGAIADVRSDATETSWFVSAFNDALELEVVATGTGGVDSLLGAIEPEKPNFGLLRVTDRIDKSLTVKFVYVVFLPPDLNPLKKARIGTLSGSVQELFRPMHVDFFINKKEELTESMVLDKVGSASGSKSKVRE